MIIWRVLGEYDDSENAGKSTGLGSGSVDQFFPTKGEAEEWAKSVTCWNDGPAIMNVRVPADRKKFCDFLNHYGGSM